MPTQKTTRKQRDAYRADPMLFWGDLSIPGIPPDAKLRDHWAPFQVEAFERIAPCLQALAAGNPPPLRGAWLERTKGSSKDSDVGLMLLWLMLFSRRPLLVELGAEKLDQAAETKDAMSDAVRLNPWMEAEIDFQVAKVICKRTGVKLEFLTTDDMGTHGSRPDLTVCNELSHVTHENFMSTMMDNADKIPWNLAIIALNAGFQRSWQERWRELYKDQSKRWYFQKVSGTAPWITEENLNNARRRNSTSRFNRLWRGLWIAGKGDALDPGDIAAAFRLDGPMNSDELARAIAAGWIFLAGVDAGARHDHSALIVLGTKPSSGRVRLCRCEWWAPGPDGRIEMSQLRDAIVRANRDFQLAACNFDPSQMEFMAQELEKINVPMVPIHFSGPNCDNMARDLLQAFRGRQIDLYPFGDSMLKDDLYSLTIRERKFGYVLQAPTGETGHADRAIALAVVLPSALIACQLPPPDDSEEIEEQIIA